MRMPVIVMVAALFCASGERLSVMTVDSLGTWAVRASCGRGRGLGQLVVICDGRLHAPNGNALDTITRSMRLQTPRCCCEVEPA